MNLVSILFTIIKTTTGELGGPNIKFRSRKSFLKHSNYDHENPTNARPKDLEYIHSIFPDEQAPYYIYPPGVSPISYVKKRIPYPEPGITPRKGIQYPSDLIHNPFDHDHGYPPSVPHNPFDHNHGYPPENPDQDVNTKERTRPFVGGLDDGDNPQNKNLKTLYDKLVNPPVPTSELPSSGQDEHPNQQNNLQQEKEGNKAPQDIDAPYNKPFKPSKDLPSIYILPVPTTEFPPSGHDPLHPYGYPPVGHDDKHPYGFLPENPESSHSSYAPPFGHDPLHPHGYLPLGPEPGHSHDLPSTELKPFEPPKTTESTFTPDVLSRGLKFEPFYPHGYPPPYVNPESIENPFAYDHVYPPNTRPGPFDHDIDYPPHIFPQFFTRMGLNTGGTPQENTQDVGGKLHAIDSRYSTPNYRTRLTFGVTKSKK